MSIFLYLYIYIYIYIILEFFNVLNSNLKSSWAICRPEHRYILPVPPFVNIVIVAGHGQSIKANTFLLHCCAILVGGEVDKSQYVPSASPHQQTLRQLLPAHSSSPYSSSCSDGSVASSCQLCDGYCYNGGTCHLDSESSLPFCQ